MNDNQFKDLDKILKYLLHYHGQDVKVKELMANVFNTNSEIDETKDVTEYMAHGLKALNKSDYIKSLLKYLENESLIESNTTKDPDYNTVKITTVGIIKITTNGFYKAHVINKFEIFTKIVTPILAVLGFILSVVNFFFPNCGKAILEFIFCN
ncbi:hypothetical protein [Flavobacterium sp. KACC 22763]|uniref:hypothetical protein n=1 Tax=Flavobacterium sp. KACC 22763 TaxID=3025668 RepID=UPI0023666457|nr:hypothetical protein [Flavobacterium sp. KACC 22763]WDF65652.1 hypothetical protein PQ463_05665 [Flavobacterium sp. KACC 22763]